MVKIYGEYFPAAELAEMSSFRGDFSTSLAEARNREKYDGVARFEGGLLTPRALAEIAEKIGCLDTPITLADGLGKSTTVKEVLVNYSQEFIAGLDRKI